MAPAVCLNAAMYTMNTLESRLKQDDYSPQKQLAQFARLIATHRRYPPEVLQYGLLPLDDYEWQGELRPGLFSKYTRKWEELRECIVENKPRLWWLMKASSILYYAACIDEIKRIAGLQSDLYHEQAGSFYIYHLSLIEAEMLALAKYERRAIDAGEKDFNIEMRLGLKALEALGEVGGIDPAWIPMHEAAGRYGIDYHTLRYAGTLATHPRFRTQVLYGVLCLDEADPAFQRYWLDGLRKGRPRKKRGEQ